MELKETEVVALKLEGEYAGTFESPKKAADKLKLDPRDVYRALTGGQIRVGEYIFILAKNYNPDIKVTYKSILRKRRFLKLKVNTKR